MLLREGGKRLLMLTVCLEDAVRRGEWKEVETLFEARAAEITRIKDAGEEVDIDVIDQVRSVDARSIGYLQESSSAVASKLFQTINSKRAIRAYERAR